MTLKFIGAGFGRTGTFSTRIALNQLGFPCYHMHEVTGNKANANHLEFWHKVANAPAGAQHDWGQVFANYTATVDNPGCCVWRELMAAYPEAKVLLTLHPGGPEAWYQSTRETIYFTETMWQFKLLKLFFPVRRKFGDMLHKLIWQRSHRGSMTSRKAAIARYHEHIAEVEAAVPPEKLLVYSVDQGWAPLCEFLGAPVPNGDFSNVNDRASMKKMIAKIAKGAYVVLAIGGAALGAILYGIVSL